METFYHTVLMGLVRQKKRIKMIEHFRENITNNGILFLQEPHSSQKTVFN